MFRFPWTNEHELNLDWLIRKVKKLEDDKGAVTSVNGSTGDVVLPIPLAFNGTPAALGTAAPGVSEAFARGDHVHPMPPALTIDPTLTISGAAADAKATGDAIGEARSDIEDLQDLTNRKAGMLVDTASGAIASFVPDSTIDNLLGVSVAVEPVQSGSGDPSPDNVRPISGWTGANIHVSPTTDAADGTTYSITFPSEAGTVYGGTLDAIAGTLTVDRAMVDIGSTSWQKLSISQGTMWRHEFTDMESQTSARIANILCSCYKTVSQNDRAENTLSSALRYVDIVDSDFTTIAEFQTARAGQTIVYPLATPITIQLDPVTIATISGQTNNVWADAGDVSVEFAADVKTYIDQKIAAGSTPIT